MPQLTNSPDLEAPGAGLPAAERLIAQIGLIAYAGMASKQQILRRFQQEAEKAIVLVQALGTDVEKRRVVIPRPRGIEDSSRNWSAAMALEHLAIVNLGIAGIIKILCGKNRAEALTEVKIQDVKPSAEAGKEQIENLSQAVDIYCRTVNRIESLRTERQHPHPWFGPLDAGGWHALAAIHNGLHRRQIEIIIDKLS